MSRRLTRILLVCVLLLASEVWAIGLGDIKLDSALNEPLRAKIDLLSATPEELAGLTIALASAETFERYGMERPFYLQEMQFNIVDGGVNGSKVQIRSRSPITEPFLTFLVEATWTSGRLLREYTVLLDPPTYTPPLVQQERAVTAPRRSTPSDSARIERQPAPQMTPAAPQPAPTSRQPAPTFSSDSAPPVDDRPYETNASGEYVVLRGETLWSWATRVRPDSRLTINQTMLAIFEANPNAFGGNINILREGALLRIPSADEIFQISRGDALDEVKRQHSAWSGTSATTATTATTATADTTTTPSLTLVPPDEDFAIDYDDDAPYEPLSREVEIEDRISELESVNVENQQSLIEIRDNELAALRQELANIRGEIYEPLFDDAIDDRDAPPTSDDLFPDMDEVMADDSDEVVADDEDVADTTIPTGVIRPSQDSGKSIVDQVLDVVTGIWGIIGGSLILVGGALIWFMRRESDDDDDDDISAIEELDADDISVDELSATSRMQAPTPEEAMVVVEQDSSINPLLDAGETVEAPIPEIAESTLDATGSVESIEDTFSSETAVNLDQSDPIAEADFHMAYGLYDQAADLINGALEADATDKGLMSKLCEIYFVWGNRDAFIDAATRLKAAVGDAGSNPEWDKIVIMGQQIASDHEMFAGAAVVGATQEVDLSFDDTGEAQSLDMDFGATDAADGDAAEEVDFLFEESADVDAGAEDVAAADQSAVDIDLEPTAGSPTLEAAADDFDKTAEMPAPEIDSPPIDDSLGQAISDSGQDADQTAEINLDDLDLDIDGLAETEIASLDDLDVTGRNESLPDLAEATGKNPEVSMDDTGIRQGLDISATGIGEGLDLDDLEPTKEMRLAADETGRMPMEDIESDQDLLDATGHTQVLSAEMAVDTAADLSGVIADGDATTLAPLDEDDDDFDFAKTEALPVDVFTGDSTNAATGEMPTLAGTDVDLDLDDLTAALEVSEVEDTIQQPGEDATVEHIRPEVSEETAEVPTMNLSPDDMSSELQDARTMTEVGTKLDLARAYVDMGDPAGARSILEEVLDEGDEGQKQQAQKLLDSLPS
ncbi:MAG: hypothetical protein IID57_00160 [Proteobacteria bacterium]|nr:hypothetical protein [Pseudomonadota bacterium]